MNMKLAGYFMVICFSLFVLSACEKEKTSEEGAFNREEMLLNYADNLILPAYQEAHNAAIKLADEVDLFVAQTTTEQLLSLKNAWVNAYAKWQFVKAYNLGPAAPQGFQKSLLEEIATFPVSESKIDQLLSSGNFNLNDFNRDSRGYLAVEYLIYGNINQNATEVLELFNNQQHRKNYLLACANHIKSKLNEVLVQWNTSYKPIFLSNIGTDVGSSTSILYNEFIKSFESIKNFKIELPLGKRPGQTKAEPQLVEAYYSGLSIYFLKLHLQYMQQIYFGSALSGNKELGFKHYLETVTGGKELVETTLIQWDNVLKAAELLTDNTPLSQLVVDNPESVETLRMELQKHTRFFKSDMSSLLGIAITFSSGDGD
jgi:predicted lipoprotein